MTLPTLEEFSEMTVNVLREDGIAEYLPTIVVEDEFFVVEGIPPEVDHRVAIQNTIKRKGLAEGGYLFGVRSGESEVTIGRRSSEGMEFMTIRENHDGYRCAALPMCEWWRDEP
jgi:hypothetical protein